MCCRSLAEPLICAQATTAAAEGDADQLANVAYATARAATAASIQRRRRRRLSGGPSDDPCGTSDHADNATKVLKATMLSTMDETQGQQSLNPEALKVTGAAVGALVEDPCEVDDDAQDTAINIVNSVVGKSSEAELIQYHIFAPVQNSITFLCGPPLPALTQYSTKTGPRMASVLAPRRFSLRVSATVDILHEWYGCW